MRPRACRLGSVIRSTTSSSSSRSRAPAAAALLIGMLLALGALPRSVAAAAASARPSSLRSAASAFLLPAARGTNTVRQRRQLTTAAMAADASAPPKAAATEAAASEAGAGQPEEFDIPHFEATPATERDLECIEERQLLHQVTCAGGPRERCQHGFPQAFVFHPSKTTFNSGLFRLSCPLLVKAVDEYEAQGGLSEFNLRMSQDPELQREFRRVNARHSAIRRQLAEPAQLKPYMDKMGPAVVEQILASGIAGVSPDKTEDLKCLHAHLADFLCTRNNGVGQLVYETLRDTRGVEVDGCGTCWQQCDVAHARTPESWWYTPIKNKQKLRSRYERRHKRKAEERQKRTQQHGAGPVDLAAGEESGGRDDESGDGVGGGAARGAGQ